MLKGGRERLKFRTKFEKNCKEHDTKVFLEKNCSIG